MVIYLAVFSALAICAGLLVAKMYEWRQDVLYGPYVGRDLSQQKSEG